MSWAGYLTHVWRVFLNCKSCTFCCWQAEQKAQEESERLRQQEREAMAEKRRVDLVSV